MILKNPFRRKTRTLLTLIGIAIGIVAIVALKALADGLAANYTTALSRSNADFWPLTNRASCGKIWRSYKTNA